MSIQQQIEACLAFIGNNDLNNASSAVDTLVDTIKIEILTKVIEQLTKDKNIVAKNTTLAKQLQLFKQSTHEAKQLEKELTTIQKQSVDPKPNNKNNTSKTSNQAPLAIAAQSANEAQKKSIQESIQQASARAAQAKIEAIEIAKTTLEKFCPQLVNWKAREALADYFVESAIDPMLTQPQGVSEEKTEAKRHAPKEMSATAKYCVQELKKIDLANDAQALVETCGLAQVTAEAYLLSALVWIGKTNASQEPEKTALAQARKACDKSYAFELDSKNLEKYLQRGTQLIKSNPKQALAYFQVVVGCITGTGWEHTNLTLPHEQLGLQKIFTEATAAIGNAYLELQAPEKALGYFAIALNEDANCKAATAGKDAANKMIATQGNAASAALKAAEAAKEEATRAKKTEQKEETQHATGVEAITASSSNQPLSAEVAALRQMVASLAADNARTNAALTQVTHSLTQTIAAFEALQAKQAPFNRVEEKKASPAKGTEGDNKSSTPTSSVSYTAGQRLLPPPTTDAPSQQQQPLQPTSSARTYVPTN